MHLPQAHRAPVPTSTPRPDGILSLLLDEIFDLNDAIDELERRRAKQRNRVLDLCREARLDRSRHPRGTLRIDRYASYKITRAAGILPLIHRLGWEDDVLSVRGRRLHQLARHSEQAQAEIAAFAREVQHEALVLTAKR